MLNTFNSTNNTFHNNSNNNFTNSIRSLSAEKNEKKLAIINTEGDKILGRETFYETFDTDAYLKDFYTNVDDQAMQMVLFYLPNIIARLPNCKSLLDFGAGPTIHVAICFRNKVDEIYLADFLPQNRQALERWKTGNSNFNWTKVLTIICSLEGFNLLQLKDIKDNFELLTRKKVSNILYCNCLADPPIEIPNDMKRKNFDIISTFYTIEYCCVNCDEYRVAIRRVSSFIRLGGYFIMGAILEENWCSFGGKKFQCLYITKEFVFDCLEDAGIDTKGDQNESFKPIIFEVNGMLIVCCQKRT